MNRTKKQSLRQEKSVAADLGGRVQKASGATDFAKGDVRKVGEVKVECKTTSAKSYSLKLDEITKIQSEGFNQGAEGWAMQIEFQGQFGMRKKVAVIDWQEYLDLKMAAQAHKSHQAVCTYDPYEPMHIGFASFKDD